MTLHKSENRRSYTQNLTNPEASASGFVFTVSVPVLGVDGAATSSLLWQRVA